MKKILILLIVATGTLTTFAQTGKDSTHKGKAATAKVVYTCPMHPDVVSDKPGKCPKCGMTLVKKTAPARKSGMGSMKMDSTKH